MCGNHADNDSQLGDDTSAETFAPNGSNNGLSKPAITIEVARRQRSTKEPLSDTKEATEDGRLYPAEEARNTHSLLAKELSKVKQKTETPRAALSPSLSFVSRLGVRDSKDSERSERGGRVDNLYLTIVEGIVRVANSWFEPWFETRGGSAFSPVVAQPAGTRRCSFQNTELLYSRSTARFRTYQVVLEDVVPTARFVANGECYILRARRDGPKIAFASVFFFFFFDELGLFRVFRRRQACPYTLTNKVGSLAVQANFLSSVVAELSPSVAGLAKVG